MICLDVYVNGERLGRAGKSELVVLSAHVDCVESEFPDAEDERPTLSVGGLYEHTSGGHVHPRWLERMKLDEGDEITFRIVTSETADAPVSKGISTREDIEQQERKYYETMKAKYEFDRPSAQSNS